VLKEICDGPPDRDLRIYLLPGIMGSQLTDRRGNHGLCWIDPLGLATGDDYLALAMTGGSKDANPAVRIEPCGPVPVIYDRLALALMAAFGPVVEQVGFDWRLRISESACQVRERMQRFLSSSDSARAVVVAHSMGGLVAAHALRGLGTAGDRVLGLCTLGTPWLGSFDAALSLRGEGQQVRLFAGLTALDIGDVLQVAHSFWGLTDLLPPRTELLDPGLYAAGPLGHEPGAAAQLQSPLAMDRTAPKDRTLAIASDQHDTVVSLSVQPCGALDGVVGPGDGTVPLWSATASGDLSHALVGASHIALPLDGDAIRITIDQIQSWLAATTKSRSLRAPIRIPELARVDVTRDADRSRLLASLERIDEATITLGQYVAMMPFSSGALSTRATTDGTTQQEADGLVRGAFRSVPEIRSSLPRDRGPETRPRPTAKARGLPMRSTAAFGPKRVPRTR
jgi:pimeloyl-ACP methyl ester carboxylesterase